LPRPAGAERRLAGLAAAALLILAAQRGPPARPELLVMTALPIVWGEKGAFDPGSRPAALYRALQQEFAVRPLDTLGEADLARSRLLLLAQPRWLSPAELAALDLWVRRGGAALILTDPNLEWPSDLPLGDVRRPPPVGLLGPLLGHWGLRLEEGKADPKERFDKGRRLAMDRPGRFTATGKACRVVRSYQAECRIGKGRAILLADADLMRDSLWLEPQRDGGAGQKRVADNPLVVAELLDALAGIERARPGDEAGPGPALPRSLLLFVIGFAVVAASLLLARRQKD
jgi:hypothetical protein